MSRTYCALFGSGLLLVVNIWAVSCRRAGALYSRVFEHQQQTTRASSAWDDVGRVVDYTATALSSSTSDQQPRIPCPGNKWAESTVSCQAIRWPARLASRFIGLLT